MTLLLKVKYEAVLLERFQMGLLGYSEVLYDWEE